MKFEVNMIVSTGINKVVEAESVEDALNKAWETFTHDDIVEFIDIISERADYIEEDNS